MFKCKAKKYLQKSLSEVDDLICKSTDHGLTSINLESDNFIMWNHQALIAIEKIFGKDSYHYKEFKKIDYMFHKGWRKYPMQNGLDDARSKIKSYLQEMDNYRWYFFLQNNKFVFSCMFMSITWVIKNSLSEILKSLGVGNK